MWGFLAGVLVTCAAVSYMSRTKDGELAASEDPGSNVAIMLWETIEGDAESELAGLGGGGLGVSHSSVDIGENDEEGHPLMIECYPGEGVIRSRRDRFGTRRHATIVLTGADAAEVRGCLRAQIGRPFDPLGLLGRPFDPLGLLGGLTNKEAMLCSTLVYRCLPAALRSRVDAARPGEAVGVAVSPAQLLLAFGGVVGAEPVYVEAQELEKVKAKGLK